MASSRAQEASHSEDVTSPCIEIPPDVVRTKGVGRRTSTFATQKSLNRIQQAMEYREEKLKPRNAHREERAAREGAATETARQINRLQFAQSLLRELARHENGVLEMQEEEKEGLEKLRKVQQNMRNCRTETTQYLHYL